MELRIRRHVSGRNGYVFVVPGFGRQVFVADMDPLIKDQLRAVAGILHKRTVEEVERSTVIVTMLNPLEGEEDVVLETIAPD